MGWTTRATGGRGITATRKKGVSTSETPSQPVTTSVARKPAPSGVTFAMPHVASHFRVNLYLIATSGGRNPTITLGRAHLQAASGVTTQTKTKKTTNMTEKATDARSSKLVVSFVAMVFVGLGNKIFQKLQTIPMHNYPMFLNLLTTFVYIPISFAYIIPMIKYGTAITAEQRSVPKKTFAVMGGLDSVAGILQVFAATYLGGSLIILLGQAAIPVSMVISSALLQTRYSIYQYVGAVVVTIGLIVVLGPGVDSSAGADSHMTIVWSMVMILSCVPMCLSSVYKEKALGETELDVVYLNGWVAVFQFMMALPLTIPAAMIGNPPVEPKDIMSNLYDGFRCYLGHNTIDHGPHKDDCANATVFVSAYIVFNVAYNLLIILILKFGSANILWLAMTIMVPLGNVAFTFPFMPEHQPLHAKDITGLLVIMSGLFVYRFLEDIAATWSKRVKNKRAADPSTSELKKALILFEDGEPHMESRV